MNSYNKYTDLQINELVATRLKKKCLLTEESVLAYMDSGYRTFDPCNNPSDAMPIIIENGISLITEGDGIYEAIGGLEIYSANSFLCDFSSTSEKIYRAGMEVFLMKRDAENENNNNS